MVTRAPRVTSYRAIETRAVLVIALRKSVMRSANPSRCRMGSTPSERKREPLPRAWRGSGFALHGPRRADARVERDGYGAARSRALQEAPHTNRVHVRKTPSLAIGGSAHRPPSTGRTGSTLLELSPSPSARGRPVLTEAGVSAGSIQQSRN